MCNVWPHSMSTNAHCHCRLRGLCLQLAVLAHTPQPSLLPCFASTLSKLSCQITDDLPSYARTRLLTVSRLTAQPASMLRLRHDFHLNRNKPRSRAFGSQQHAHAEVTFLPCVSHMHAQKQRRQIRARRVLLLLLLLLLLLPPLLRE